jgi:hypothetical protein
MPLDTQPEDLPAAIRFSISGDDGSRDNERVEVACALLTEQQNPPYRIEGGTPRFENRDAFKARAVYAGLTPAVAEDAGRSFNATARQLRELGFVVKVIEEQKKTGKKKEMAA